MGIRFPSFFTVNSKKPSLLSKEIINGNKSAILLVEDNEDLLDFIAKDLANNYIVRKAVNAEIALEILKEENIQLVITDVMMPGMDGFTFPLLADIFPVDGSNPNIINKIATINVI